MPLAKISLYSFMRFFVLCICCSNVGYAQDPADSDAPAIDEPSNTETPSKSASTKASQAKSKNSKSKKSKSKSSNLSSSGYEKEGNGGKGVHLFHHKTPADGSLDNGSYHKERAQELHVTKTGGGHQREPVQSVFHERREGGA